MATSMQPRPSDAGSCSPRRRFGAKVLKGVAELGQPRCTVGRSPQKLLQDVVPALESVLTWLLPLGFAAVLLCSTTVRDKLLTAQQSSRNTREHLQYRQQPWKTAELTREAANRNSGALLGLVINNIIIIFLQAECFSIPGIQKHHLSSLEDLIKKFPTEDHAPTEPNEVSHHLINCVTASEKNPKKLPECIYRDSENHVSQEYKYIEDNGFNLLPTTAKEISI
ncbi:hypothetical protein Anapl_10666 [Anas platyrhynchos]|uniref:Uncharacterized protein n=1 Tax=Anas platyrhynchos TaxID=8839 RepID=R0KA20_ANAPL|nr:hypothetical protein Anapl_10666 [Anas platyrhynchos]